MTGIDKDAVKGWVFYDWANSVYSLVISTAIFPIYYESITQGADTDQVTFLGLDFTNTALYSYALSFSFLLVAGISPLLSGIADYTNRKKSFLRRFCYLGSISCGLLFFFKDVNTLWIAIAATILASVGFWGSQVFYNAYLPELVPRKLQDKTSAKGYAMGYLGGAILLIVCLVIIQGPFIEDTAWATRLCFLLVAIWWLGFAQITFLKLPEESSRKSIHWRTISKGYQELLRVAKSFNEMRHVRVYLISFVFFSMGVQTVILLASLFGKKELGLETSQLILTILLIQFVGIGGSYLFAKLSKKMGNFVALKLAICLWIGVTIAAYSMDGSDPYVAYKFYAMGGLVGLVMGGIQSLARSTYSKMLPKEGEHATYFSFYDVAEKLAIVIGTFSYGLIEELSGSMHQSALTLGLFFIVSLIVLQMVKIPEKHSNYEL